MGEEGGGKEEENREKEMREGRKERWEEGREERSGEFEGKEWKHKKEPDR